jgi:trk system potassium uptake protein TrkH
LQELLYAVRFRVVVKYLGQLCIALAFLAAVPTVVALAWGDYLFALRFLGVTTLVGLLGLLSRIRAPTDVQMNEALVIIALMFLLAPLVMTYPMMTDGLGFIDALFEATSGITTTGLTTAATVEDKSQAFLFARAWMQWFGGLGFIALSGVILTHPGPAAKHLLDMRADEQDLAGGTRARARRVFRVYSAMTVVGFSILWLSGAGWYDGLLHVFAAVSTGGFSTHDASLAAFGGSVARGAVFVLFFAGALPAALYWRAYGGRWSSVAHDVQLRGLLIGGTVVAAALLLSFPAGSGMSLGQRVGHSVAMAFSAQTTTGFSTIDPARIPAGGQLVLIISMFIGGGIGSTAGGIKILRLLILFRVLQLALMRTAAPRHAVVTARLGGRRLESDEVREAMLVAGLFAAATMLSWLAFVYAGHEPLPSLFEVTSAVGTVGLSTGLSGPELESGLKLLLCADMVFGRLEALALLALIFPRTWIGNRRRSR